MRTLDSRTPFDLPDRFEFVRPLGEGGMGVVYEVFDRARGEAVALKAIRETHGNAMYRMKREFRAIAELEHPNLVRLHDLFVDRDRCFFTMELVRGAELTTWATRALSSMDELAQTVDGAAPAFDEAAIRHAVAGIAAGIDALHGAGLLHRDLKPSNVLVNDEGRVVVLDFGLVADAYASAQQTIEGQVAGTIAYMAPEQARGEVELTRAVDSYALGVVLHELLTGRLPHEGAALMVLAAKQGHEAPRPSLRAIRGDGIPRDLDDLATALLARDPMARPTMSDVRRVVGMASKPSSRTPSSNSMESSSTIFGRDRELAVIDDALRATSSGRPSLVLVRGRSGIGKSAVLGAYARRAERDRRAVVLSGRCHEREAVPFKGLDGVVDALSRHLAATPPEELGRLLPPNTADLGTLFPVLRRIAPIAAAYARRASTDRTQQRVRAEGFACLAELLRRIADVAPLLVVVDDIQWADEDTATGLIELFRSSSAPAMALLLGTRPTDESPVEVALFGQDVAPTIAALRRDAVELDALDDDSIARIARRELGKDASASLVESVARDAHGNPFAAGELVRFLREDDSGDVGASGEGTSIPSSIDALVRRRAESLDAGSRRLLELIVLAGEPTDTIVLLRAAEIGEGDRVAIERLRARHWIRTQRATSATLLDTVHDRVREAILESIGEAERHEHHRRLAAALETVEHPAHDRLARHFAAAGERALAYHHAIEAARLAQASLAFRRASELYGLAIELGSPTQARDLYPTYAESLSAAGRFEAAADAWLEASRRAHADDARERLRLAGEAKLHAGRIDEGLAILEKTAAQQGVRFHRNRWIALAAGLWERIRLSIRGLDAKIRPRTDVDESKLRRLREVESIAASYSALDFIVGMAPQTRLIRQALDLGVAESCVTALLAEATFRGLAGDDRAARLSIQALSALAPHEPEKSRHAITFAEFCRQVGTGDVVALERLVPAHVGSLELGPFPDWLKSPFVSALGASLRDHLDTTRWKPVLRFVERRDETAGPFAEMRTKSAILPHLHLRLGRPEAVRAWTSEERWGAITKRQVMLKAAAVAFDACAILYEGDARAAFARAHEALAGARESFSTRVLPVIGLVAIVVAATGVAVGDEKAVRRALRLIRGGGTHKLRLRFRLHLEALLALVQRRDERAALERLAAFAHAHRFEAPEAAAHWALGRLDPGPGGESSRNRYVAMIEGTGIVDPDRFMWTCLPVGEPPPRTMTERSAWHSDG